MGIPVYHTHELKLRVDHFEAKLAGLKNWEIRNNDRDFQGGDLVTFHEWDTFKGLAGEYTGRVLGPYAIQAPIVSMTDGLQPGFVIFQHTPHIVIR